MLSLSEIDCKKGKIYFILFYFLLEKNLIFFCRCCQNDWVECFAHKKQEASPGGPGAKGFLTLLYL